MTAQNPTDPLTTQEAKMGEELAEELFGRRAMEVPPPTLRTLQRALAINNQVLTPPEWVASRLVRHHHQTMQLTNEHALPIRFLGLWRIPESFDVFEGPDCDWVLLSLPDDPLYQHFDDHLPVPGEVNEVIQRMTAAGITFSNTFIAHAVPKGAMANRSEVTLDLVVPQPAPQVAARLRFLDQGISKIRRATEAAVRGIAVAGAAISAGALTASLAAAATVSVAAAPLALIDPILLGCEAVDGWETSDAEPIGSFFYLGHWHWPLEVKSA